MNKEGLAEGLSQKASIISDGEDKVGLGVLVGPELCKISVDPRWRRYVKSLVDLAEEKSICGHLRAILVHYGYIVEAKRGKNVNKLIRKNRIRVIV